MTIQKHFVQEQDLQEHIIYMLQNQGYTVISSSEANKKRGFSKNVLFTDELQSFLNRQTYSFGNEKRLFSGASIARAMRSITDPYMDNKKIYDLLCHGKTVIETLPDGTSRSYKLLFIDFEHPENNKLQVTMDYVVERDDRKYIRPDLVVLINGIPIVVADFRQYTSDIRDKKMGFLKNMHEFYSLTPYNYFQLIFMVSSNEIRYGTGYTSTDTLQVWQQDGLQQENFCKEYSPKTKLQKTELSFVSLLAPECLLDIIKNFVFYENHVKRVCRYNQYLAVEKAISRINLLDGANTRNGIIWQVEGSGRSITMLFLLKKLLNQPVMFTNNKKLKFILVSDRPNLAQALRENFQFSKLEVQRARTGKALLELLEQDDATIIISNASKFEAAVRRSYCNENEDIVLLMDGGYRIQYNGLLNRINRVFPNAIKLAFTGVPLMKRALKEGKQVVRPASAVYDEWGPMIDIYTNEDAVKDGVLTHSFYVNRIIPSVVTNTAMNRQLKLLTAGLEEEAKNTLVKKYKHYVKYGQQDTRLNAVAFDLHKHFLRFIKPKGLKAVLACSSLLDSVKVFYKLKYLGGIKAALLIKPEAKAKFSEQSSSANEQKMINKFFYEEFEVCYSNKYLKYEDSLFKSFKRSSDDADLLIISDKMPAYLDIPMATALYVDRELKGYDFWQSISYVNRVYENKHYSMIVDYNGSLGDNIDEEKSVASQDYDCRQAYEDNVVLKPTIEVSERLEEEYHQLKQIYENYADEDGGHSFYKNFMINESYSLLDQKLAIFKEKLDLLYSSYDSLDKLNMGELEQYHKLYTYFIQQKEEYSISKDSCKLCVRDYFHKINEDEEKNFKDTVVHILRKYESVAKEEKLKGIAEAAKEIIIKNKKIDWHDNIVINRTIKKELDDLLFDYMEANSVEWDFKQIDAIIDEIMLAAKKRY